MAHLIVEMSDTVAGSTDSDELCEALHRGMVETGIFPLAGIRVRAYRADACAIADEHPSNGFVALTLIVGHGRTKADLAVAGEIVFTAAKQHLHDWLSEQFFGLSLEIREIDPDLTWKANTIRPRLLAEKGSEQKV
jgi:5-carboxymethyl-2-hydroxymuconate isomerase